MIFVFFECVNAWSTREIDDWPKPYSLIKYLRMGDDLDIVYDEASEKKLVMKNWEGVVFMMLQHSKNANIHSVCDIYRNN